MRQFSILVIFVVAFGGAAVLYEKESRKVKGVLTQITELQAQVGDLQAEVNRLNSELEAAKLSERRRPRLSTIAKRARRDRSAAESAADSTAEHRDRGRQLRASDVTSSGPAIRSPGSGDPEAGWDSPTVDVEDYRPLPPDSSDGSAAPVVDPYQ